jgi:hypothetical protein
MTDLTDEEFFDYPPFDPSGKGGVLHLEKPVWTRDSPRWVTRKEDGEYAVLPLLPNWPLFGWKTTFAPARPSPMAILDWLDLYLKPAGLLDLGEAFDKRLPATTAESRMKGVGNFRDDVCDLRLLLKAYANAWPTLRT